MLKKFFKSSNIKVVAVEEEKEYLTFREFLKGTYQELLGRIVAKKMSKAIYDCIRKIFFQKSVVLFTMMNGVTYRIRVDEDNTPQLEEVDAEEIVIEIVNKEEWLDLQNALICKGMREAHAKKISENAIRRFADGEVAIEKTKQLIIATKYWKSTYLTLKSIWR